MLQRVGFFPHHIRVMTSGPSRTTGTGPRAVVATISQKALTLTAAPDGLFSRFYGLYLRFGTKLPSVLAKLPAEAASTLDFHSENL